MDQQSFEAEQNNCSTVHPRPWENVWLPFICPAGELNQNTNNEHKFSQERPVMTNERNTLGASYEPEIYLMTHENTTWYVTRSLTDNNGIMKL